MRIYLIILLTGSVLVVPARSSTLTGPNAVTDWSAIAQQAINNAAAPRPPASAQVLQAMVMLAVYDAVMAIEGGYVPFAASIQAPLGADVAAAVATAAYLTARARVAASQVPFLDQQYVSYLAGIPDGQAEDDGVRVGQAAAAAMLALRAADRFNNVVLYQCSATPPPVEEFDPNTGCPTLPTSPQPVDTKVGHIVPFTFSDPAQFRPDGPDPLTSNAYTEDFIETRDYGRSNSAFRSPEQTDIAYFWSENSHIHWNRNLIALALASGLNVRESARFFAMVHTAAADAVIAGFEAKYFYRTSRPRTAIPRAAEDGNPDTDPDPTWTPLLTVNHPEYPSGHAFYSTAVTDAVAAYFGTNKLTWTLDTSKTAVPQVVQTHRTYTNLNAMMREIDDARIWAGLHWRHAMRHGGQIGRKVARHIVRHFFQPVTANDRD
jgi:hypothetical protein